MKIIMMKNVLLALCLVGVSTSFAQNDSAIQEKYPEGIYKTFEDFKAINPIGSKADFTIKTGNDTISHRFFSPTTEKRMKKEFAFSDGKDVYVSVVEILENLSKEDRGQMVDGGNYHLKAINSGSHYLYFEDYFSSKNAQLLGGTIAAVASRRLKGVVYNKKDNSFNLFRNAEDFEQFIEKNHPDYASRITEKEDPEKRKKKIEDINLIREIIFEINRS